MHNSLTVVELEPDQWGHNELLNANSIHYLTQ